jgi:hypothetical protein
MNFCTATRTSLEYSPQRARNVTVQTHSLSCK